MTARYIPQDAVDIAYDNSASGLAANELQAATDELDGRIDSLEVAPPAHAASHEVGGSDQVDHDQLLNFVSNEHIDWTVDQSPLQIDPANLPAASSGVQFVDNAESQGVSSTSNTGFQQKVRLALTGLVAGTYMVSFYAEARHQIRGDAVECRIEQNDVTLLNLQRFYTGDAGGIDFIDDFLPFTGYRILALSGDHNFDLDYRTIAGNFSAIIRRASVTAWRLS